jgi:hypothetical protein
MKVLRLRSEAEVELSQGKAMGHAVRKLGITKQTYYRWCRDYNTLRPHSSLGYWPPAPEAIETLPYSLGLRPCAARLMRR